MLFRETFLSSDAIYKEVRVLFRYSPRLISGMTLPLFIKKKKGSLRKTHRIILYIQYMLFIYNII